MLAEMKRLTSYIPQRGILNDYKTNPATTSERLESFH
jgi:hypothetical protein